MKSDKRAFRFLCLGIAILAVGCSNPEIETERSKLELARAKTDLDQMFLSLSRLVQLGDESSNSQLARIRAAVESRERMNAALSDHDHESALQAANELRKLFPDSKEAIRTIRESGQIFWLLQHARESVASPALAPEPPPISKEPDNVDKEELRKWRTRTAQAALRTLEEDFSDDDGVLGKSTEAAVKSALAETKYKGGDLDSETVTTLQTLARLKLIRLAEEEWDARRFASLARARELVEKARSLDPQFKGAIQLSELLDKAHSALLITAALKVQRECLEAISNASEFHDILIEGLQLAAGSRYSSVTAYWKRSQDNVADFYSLLKKGHLRTLDLAARNAATYSFGANVKLAEHSSKSALSCTRGVDRLLSPSGNLVEFRRAGVEVTEEMKSIWGEFDTVLPDTKTFPDYLAASKMVESYSLFERPDTRRILDENEEMFSL